jgi:hypothetical protein
MGSDNKPESTPVSLHRLLLKAKYSFYSALVFFLFANPETYNIFQRFFGEHVTFVTAGGVPTVHGVFLQTLFFFLTMLGLMLLPSE